MVPLPTIVAWPPTMTSVIVMGLGHDAVPDLLIQPDPDHRAQQPARLIVPQAPDLQVRQPLKLLARMARGEHQCERQLHL
jgi:hypothetical protein